MEDSCILVPPPPTLSTPLQHRLFPNWQPGRCDLSLGNKLKSDSTESGEWGGGGGGGGGGVSCSNSKPKYLQVSYLSFADTLLLLEFLFSPILQFHTLLTGRLNLQRKKKANVCNACYGNLNIIIFLNRLFHGEA